MRLGAPLVAAVVGLLGAVQTAAAGHCGADKYASCSEPSCDAQCCFTPCQQQCKTCYKLVWDTCLEKRWKTCYQTVQETHTKQVCKTCYREECRTCYKPCYETAYRTVCETVCKPRYETCWKECRYVVCRKVPETCYKEVCYTVCKPVYEQHVNKCCHQIQQKIEGNMTFYTARGTAYPQPLPGAAPSPGPLTVPAGQLGSYLGIREVRHVSVEGPLAVTDTSLAI
jgi:hypothetical protein